jgi:hypothetical protein
MATLNSSNITNGNTVEPNDLLQLYDAFKPGGGTTGAYSVSISGSLTGSASTSISSSYATSASYSVTASYASNTNSASYAVTASYASNTDNSTLVSVTSQGQSLIGMHAIAGYTSFNSLGVTSASINFATEYPSLPMPTALGTDLWITANATDDPTPSIRVTWDDGNGTIVFYDETGTYQGNLVFTGYVHHL